MTRTLRITVIAVTLIGAVGFASAQQVKDGGSSKTGGPGLSDNPLKPEIKSDQNAADEAKPPADKDKSRKDAIKAK
jgi:hypothetical protein